MGLGIEELQDIEGDVGAALKLAGVDDDEPTDLVRVCVALTGGEPQVGPMRRREGQWDGRRVHVRLDLYGSPRGRQVVGHELAHAWAQRFLRREVSEEWCDCFGAMLSAPRRAVRAAIAVFGHRVTRLAVALQIEPAASLLRLGECSGRPVALIRRPGVIVARGEPFPWPPTIAAAVAARALGLHPVRVGARWGMMRVG